MVKTARIWLDTQMDEGPRTPHDVFEGDLNAIGLRSRDVDVIWSGTWFEPGEVRGEGAWYGYVVVTLEPEAAARLVDRWYRGAHELSAHLGDAPR